MNRNELREHDLKDDIGRSPEELEHETGEARANLDRTLTELENRLSPGAVLDKAIGVLKENGVGFTKNLVTQVRNNPMPTLLTGLGVTWLARSSKEPPVHHPGNGTSPGGRVSRAAGATASAVGNAAGRTASAVGSVAGTTRDAVGGVAHATQAGARGVKDGFVYMRHEHPLVLGALAVAIGAGIGTILPRTKSEDRWMGDMSDRATERLKEEGRQKKEEVKETVAKATDAAKEEVKAHLES